MGAIHASQSPRCNTVILVQKKARGLHLCIDFCKLNARTKKDSYPLPWIQETSESLMGAGCFSCLENPRIFQMQMYAVQAVQCSSQFQRLMQNCLGGLNLTYCLIYLDDVIVFLKMKEEHMQHLHVVFNHFWEHNLKLKPTKCKFFQDEINYLSHHISKQGVRPNKENLRAVAMFVPPQTYTEIQAFPGLAGHCWKFIKGFACKVQPLHEHLFGEGASKKCQ